VESKIIVLNSEDKVEGIIDKAYDIIVKTEMLTRTNGYETLEFKIPFNYKKRNLLFNERKLEVDDRHYIIRLIDDSKSSSNITVIKCDATWYDLADGELLNHTSVAEFSARDAIDEQLVGTGWTSGIIEIETTHQFTLNEENTRLYNLRYIHKLYGGDMWFDTKEKKVHLFAVMGKKTKNIFKYEKNTSSIKRTIDSRELITRFIFYGKEGIDISEINGGLPYVENYSYYDQLGIPRKLKTYKYQDERFTNKAYMKWYMEQWLSQHAFPATTYQITPTVVKEEPQMGDYIYVIDEQLGLKKWLRILAMEENKLEPWKTKYTLENVFSDISDLLNDENQSLSSSNTVYTGGQFGNMSPYNLLLNSRADDGLAYWQSNGFEIDDYTSKSGYSSFKTVAGTTKTKKMTQTVYPSTKDNYTVSAQVQLPEGYVYEQGDMVGIEVEIEYEDGSVQTEFISVFGNFNEQNGEV
jgi:phage minor structural protein